MSHAHSHALNFESCCSDIGGVLQELFVESAPNITCREHDFIRPRPAVIVGIHRAHLLHQRFLGETVFCKRMQYWKDAPCHVQHFKSLRRVATGVAMDSCLAVTVLLVCQTAQALPPGSS